MSHDARFSGPRRVTDDDVWRRTRTVFLAAAILFLLNILLGFANTVTPGSIPRWQILTHLHAGTVGWITLAVIGVTVWLFTGDRRVSDAYARRVQSLARLSILAFVGLVASFGLAFSLGGAAVYLVPIFGSVAALVIWAAAIFALAQLRRLPAVTTAHLLVVAGLVIASLGVTVGAWIGLDTAADGLLPVTYDQGIFGHQLTVETYLLLVATGIVEWFGSRGTADRWTKAGLAQVAVGTAAGLGGPLALVLLALGFSEAAVGGISIVSLVGFLLFTAIFLYRTGWRTVRTGPFRTRVRAWSFFGTLWLVVYVVSFFVAPAIGSPDWMTTLTLHAIFVGVMTNLLLGVLTARTRPPHAVHTRAELAAVWLLNAGMVLFFLVAATMDANHGAVVMGAGALLGVGTMLQRLVQHSTEDASPHRASDSGTD